MGNCIRFCKLVETHHGENSFDVSRPNILGNPYTHIKNKETKALVKVKSREEAVKLYSKYFDKMYENDEEYKNAVDEMYKMFKKHDVIYIGCYCKTNEECHADIIIQKLKQRSMLETLQNIKERKNTK